MEFAHSGLLIGNVGESGARGDGIDGCIADVFELFGGALEECALMPNFALDRERFDVTEHGGGNVREKDSKRRPNAVNGAEGNQTFAGADVDERHARSKLRPVENAISVAFDLGTDTSLVLGIVGVAAVQKPIGPQIGLGA